MSSTDDPLFKTLSTRTRGRIDDAFDSVVLQWTTGNVEEDEPGGFVIEDVRPKTITEAQSHIPLSEIPRALGLLGLSPDEDVMGVFKNAAAGWGAESTCNDGVSRKDWRAVCAALLEGERDDGSDEEMFMDQDVGIDADSGPDSDEYQTEEVSGDTEDDSSDEYEELGGKTTRTKSAKAKYVERTPTTRTTGRESRRELTESQKAQCRQDFARFFPHVPDNELDQQQIMVKDINRVAGLLKESLKAEDILDMLEAFSTSPDKSMNLTDFEHMMILAKLI